MIMQPAHFELIAKTIAGIPHGDRGPNLILDDEQHEQVAEHFANQLSQTSPNFNRAKFLAACGVED